MLLHDSVFCSSTGLTLPVWVSGAARAALQALRGEPFQRRQPLELLIPAGVVPVAVQAAAPLADGWAMGEAICDPGERLDLTRGLVIWVLVRWTDGPGHWLDLESGEGVGLHAATGEPCLSAYARQLLEVNLRPLVPVGRRLRLRVVFPAGRELAERTSNAAFGVVEGLALIGTQAEVQAGADPSQLQEARLQMIRRRQDPTPAEDLVLVIGENGLDLAPRLGLPPELLLKGGNWIGPLLVAAAEAGFRRLLLFGYQGKLIKLAGGIFHTHHHLADGRSEVLTALAALEGLVGEPLAALHAAPTVEAALAELDLRSPALAGSLRARIARTIEERTRAYLERHGQMNLSVGAALFDRSRRICAVGPSGADLLESLKGTT